jgi:hypothetical protein
MTLSIAAHELIYVADAYGRRGRLHHVAFLGGHARGGAARADIFLEHDVHIEAAPSKHPWRRASSSTATSPAATDRGHHRGYFVYDPDFGVRSSGPRPTREGPGLGRQDRRELPHLRHARGGARVSRTVRDAAFDVLRERGLTTIFANPGSTEVSLLPACPTTCARARAARGLGRRAWRPAARSAAASPRW